MASHRNGKGREKCKSKLFLAGLAMALAFSFGGQAGIDLNEVGAFLVYPGVAATANGLQVETFLTITNTSSDAIIAHVSFINGNEDSPKYCYECDFDVPMSGLDTETLVLIRQGQRHHHPEHGHGRPALLRAGLRLRDRRRRGLRTTTS